MESNPPPAFDPRALLGEFTSDLWFPAYRPLARGDWSISVVRMAALRGYWGQVYRVNGSVILTGPTRGTTAAWMSIDPVEIESQAIGIAAARGHTAVLGLGLGWMAANAALNPAVERVSVVERDPEVIALVADLGVFDQLPAAARAKLTLVQADALTWRPPAPVDVLLADIWAKYVEPQKLDEVRRMQANIAADALYVWSQEMELWRLACRAQDRVPEALDEATLTALIAATGLPLIRPETDPGQPDYAARITAAARWWTPKVEGWWREGA